MQGISFQVSIAMIWKKHCIAMVFNESTIMTLFYLANRATPS